MRYVSASRVRIVAQHLAADLIIEAIAEPHADEQTAAAHPEVADTRIAPYCLIVRARKP
jgi:hypothetical protein